MMSGHESWRDVAGRIAKEHGLTFADLMSRSRVRSVAHARQEAYSVIYDAGFLSSVRIGQLFGGRDHGAVLYGIKAHKARMSGVPLKRSKRP